MIATGYQMESMIFVLSFRQKRAESPLGIGVRKGLGDRTRLKPQFPQWRAGGAVDDSDGMAISTCFRWGLAKAVKFGGGKIHIQFEGKMSPGTPC